MILSIHGTKHLPRYSSYPRGTYDIRHGNKHILYRVFKSKADQCSLLFGLLVLTKNFKISPDVSIFARGIRKMSSKKLHSFYSYHRKLFGVEGSVKITLPWRFLLNRELRVNKDSWRTEKDSHGFCNPHTITTSHCMKSYYISQLISIGR